MRSIAAALILCGHATVATAQAPRVTGDPDSARLITSDVERFWQVYDLSAPDSLAVLLQREYLDRGTAGLRDFIPGRILSAEQLAQRILAEPDRYESRRDVSMAALAAEPAIRSTFRELKRIYPDAVFPDVYFVIGRFNSGGTVSSNGLLIGAEMQRNAAGFPRIVAHELVHFQQPPARGPVDLLAASYREGSADFIGELISGSQINSAAHEYGFAHEAELWKEFSTQMHGFERNGWLYGGQPEGRPADLGYFIGYRIAQAYYERMDDKAQAVRDILTFTDYPELLRRSGYAPGR